MSSTPLNRPLSRLFRPGAAPQGSPTEQSDALNAASPEEIRALAMGSGEEALRAAAIERLEDAESLMTLAGLDGAAGQPADIALLARQRLAALVDADVVGWDRVRSDSANPAVLVQVAELCANPALLEQVVASIGDPQEIARLVLEGSSIRVQQLAAQRIEDREQLNRLLKQLQGKDKSVYRILKDKRDAQRAEVHQHEQTEHEIRTIFSSLEALLSRPYDALFAPAYEHFSARWLAYEGRAQPWARERVRLAIDRCQAVLTEHQREAEQQAAQRAAESARQIAAQAAREQAIAQAAEANRQHEEAAARAALEAEEIRQAEHAAREERLAAEAHRLRQIGALMAKAHGALRAGHTGPAAGLRRAIEEKLTGAPALPPALARGLQELDEKLKALKEWKDYAVSPKRAELIAAMEALIGSEAAPPAIAERIRELRGRWKTISQGVLVDSEADWQRFNQAAATAYEPCRKYFEAQAALRAANGERRRRVLERLLAFETGQSGEHPDWRTIGQVLHEAPLEWRRVGPVDWAAIRTIETEFEAALARLRAKLDGWHKQNAQDKKALIERAAALLELSDGSAAVEGAKVLQRRWREIGPALRAQEGTLWNEFRAHCDNVFKKRQEAYAVHAAGLESSKVQAIALCEDVERAAGLSGTALLEAVKGVAQWRTAFDALGELPRPEARALRTRFERALTVCESQMAQQRRQEAALRFDHLIEAAQRIDTYGWAVAQELASSERDALKTAAETFIAGIAHWPKGSAPALKAAWAKAEIASSANTAANESALRLLCVRAEIATERATPDEDQALRRSYQLERLVQVMGRREEAAVNDWESLALEWAGVGPVSPQDYESLLARFRLCRK
jgi:hypothetical protein